MEARRAANRAFRALARLQQAEKRKDIEIWTARETQRERVVALSQKLQLKMVNNIQATIGLKKSENRMQKRASQLALSSGL